MSNTRLTYQIIPGLRTALSVDNLLDEDYEVYVELPGGAGGPYTIPGRTVTAALIFER